MATLRIEHRTVYSYNRPVSFGRHRLVLRPREGPDLRIVSEKLELTPAHHLLWSRDVFGNAIALVEFTEAADRLEIHSEVVVQRQPPLPPADAESHWTVDFPPTYDPIEAAVTAVYQQVSYRNDLPALRGWLKEKLPAKKLPDDAEAVIAMIGRAVHESIRYLRRSEKGVQSPAQSLALGTGSCRDMATLMMDAARELGLATRFASGYLDCAASLAGRASTHAWVEVYLPDLGWRGFDPTIGESTSLKHVVTGVSTHPRGVMPVSGRFLGDGSDFRDLAVSVKTETVAMSP